MTNLRNGDSSGIQPATAQNQSLCSTSNHCVTGSKGTQRQKFTVHHSGDDDRRRGPILSKDAREHLESGRHLRRGGRIGHASRLARAWTTNCCGALFVIQIGSGNDMESSQGLKRR